MQLSRGDVLNVHAIMQTRFQLFRGRTKPESPTPELTVPSGHRWHWACPLLEVKNPAGHLEPLPLTFFEEKVPTGHGIQSSL